MTKEHSAVDLARAGMDKLFPGLLSDSQMQAVHDVRMRRAKARAKKSGAKITSKDFREVRPDEYVIRDGGFEIDRGTGSTKNVDDFDILAYMNDAEDPATGTLRDMKLDMRELHHAKNIYDFTTNVLGQSPNYNQPWARQLWVGLNLFGEVCPVCTKPGFFDIERVPKDLEINRMCRSITLLEHGVCPRCKRSKLDLIKNHGLHNYNVLANVLGQRSGKSSSAFGTYSPYTAHQFLMFPSISQLVPTMMQKSTELTYTFVSLTFEKANGVMWTPFMRTIEDSPWFNDYFSLLDRYGERDGQKYYARNVLFLKFGHKGLKFYPSGPKSTTLRGDTRIGGGFDELGLFPLPKGDQEEDSQSVMANADEAYNSMSRSMLTAGKAQRKLLAMGFNSAPSVVLKCVSSPYSRRDRIMRLLRDSKVEPGSNTILGVNLSTWEMNPEMTRDEPEIVQAYAQNWEKAERDYGANPPAVHSRYIDLNSIKTGVFMNGTQTHRLVYQYDKAPYLYGKLEPMWRPRFPSLVTIDAGLNDNSFTFIGGHYDFDLGKAVCTTVLELMPHDGLRINHNLTYLHIILPLLKYLNAVGLLADQWQSIDILNRAEQDMGMNPDGKPNCRTKQHSPRRKDFDNVSGMLAQKNILLPTIGEDWMKKIIEGEIDDYRSQMNGYPVEHLMLQMSTVRDVGPMRCPEKGENFTDDIYRAFVLWASKLYDPKVMQRLSEARSWMNNGEGSSMPKPVYVSRGR